MYTAIDLNIGGVDFTECLVDFDYEPADSGSSVQPPYDEQLSINRVQFELSECDGFDVTLWADLQDLHFHLIEPQVLDWIHAKQENERTEAQISKVEGDILYNYIDRLKDPDPKHDPLDKIVAELVESFESAKR